MQSLLKKYGAFTVRLSKGISRKGLYAFLGDQFSRIPPGAAVLSVGSGGDVNRLLDRHAAGRFSVTSLDIDAGRNPDILGDVCSHDLGNSRYDVVVMSEVLEHLHSPHLAIANIRNSLKPGGKLVLTTPFALPIHEAPHDYYRYTRHGLLFLLSAFASVEIRERDTYFEAIDTLWVRLWQEKSRRAKLLSLFVIPAVCFLKRPFSVLLGKLAPADGITTGYTTVAIKASAAEPASPDVSVFPSPLGTLLGT